MGSPGHRLARPATATTEAGTGCNILVAVRVRTRGRAGSLNEAHLGYGALTVHATRQALKPGGAAT